MSAEWIKTAKVGDRVVCINASGGNPVVPFKLYGGMDGLRQGSVYTIRDFYYDDLWGHINVRLQEIERRPLGYVAETGENYEVGYNPARFRPVQPRKTDISQFQALLTSTPTHKPVRENA